MPTENIIEEKYLTSTGEIVIREKMNTVLHNLNHGFRNDTEEYEKAVRENAKDNFQTRKVQALYG